MQRVENQQELTQEETEDILDELIDFIETEGLKLNKIGCDLAFALIAYGIYGDIFPPGWGKLYIQLGILLALVLC